MSSFVERVRKSREAVWRIPLLLALIAGGVVVQIYTRDYNSSCTLVGNVTNCQCAPVGEWSQIYWYSAVLVITAQLSLTVREFFLGEGPSFWSQMRYLFTGSQASQRAAVSRHQVGFWTLMPSAMISWIFAKSINNAASWGGRFGVMGGVAYAGWYTSFFSAGLVGYWLRTRHGFASLPSAVDRCFGPAGLVCLNLALLFRLWNEVWSNVSVVANFYSDTPRTQAWWLAAIVSGVVPAVYVCMGGMRASLFSDVVQAVLGLFLLFYLMGIVSYEMRAVDVWSWQPVGGYQPGGGTALCAALVQGFISYPFHDPVLTDRTFLSTPRTMLASFVVGGAIAAMFIILFSAVGILGDYLADPPLGVVGRGDPANVARALCGVTFGIMNLIMMTSSLSTLDSTYTSCSKLIALELVGWARLDDGDTRACRGPMTAHEPAVSTKHIAIGRVSILALTGLGLAYLHVTETEIIQATTVSGTMVMGLGPPILLMLVWRFDSAPDKRDGWRRAPLAFVLSFAAGLTFGILYLLSGFKDAAGAYKSPGLREALMGWKVGDGPYAMFLGVNLVGLAVCVGACALGFVAHQLSNFTPRCKGEPTVENPSSGARVPRPGFEALAAKIAPTLPPPADSEDKADATSKTAPAEKSGTQFV